MKKIILFALLLVFITTPSRSQTHMELHKKAEIQANQGMKFLKQGNYKEAYSLLRESWQFYNENRHEFSVDYANLAHGIGQYYMSIGVYDKADEYYAIAINTLKNGHIDDKVYRSTLTDIGLYYLNLHNYSKAKSLYEEAKYLYEKNLDLGRNYARLLSNYSILQSYMGNLLMAKMYIDMSKDIYFTSPQIDSSELPVIYSNIALTYYQLGFTEEAISILQQALSFKNGSSYKEGLSEVLYALGIIHFDQKQYKEAKKYIQKAYNIRQHSDFAIECGMGVALTNYMLNENDCQKLSHSLADRIMSDVLSKFVFLSNNERDLYWKYNNDFLSLANVFLADSHEKRYNCDIYNNTLFAKGLLLKTANHIKRNIMKSKDSNSIILLERMIKLEEELNENENSQIRTEQIKDSINIIDKQLTKSNANYAEFKNGFMPDWKIIRKSLSKDEAAIEFVLIPIVDKDSVLESKRSRYYGMIITKNSICPTLVPLCTDIELQELIANKNNMKLERYIKNLYSTGNSRMFVGDKLYKNIWKPLEKYLDNIKTIYYSPVGQLNSIAFNALMSDSITLCEKYSLRLLSSTAEVENMEKKTRTKVEDAIVYGGIEYDLPAEQLQLESGKYTSLSANISHQIEHEENRSGWNYLSGTKKEAENIHKTLDSIGVHSVLVMGKHANEESLKSLSGKSPYLLHIATHGFFLSDTKQVAFNPFIQKKGMEGKSNLLLRSGLLFAGANKAWTDGESVKGCDDGILTAEEISMLDLSTTEIVALSACETGLGEVVSTEGVFGLQRAFKLAGVKTLIMSLWKVPDVATSQLMILFYNNWLSGMEIHQAFKCAQMKIKEKYSSPYYWAGFVMLD